MLNTVDKEEMIIEILYVHMHSIALLVHASTCTSKKKKKRKDNIHT